MTAISTRAKIVPDASVILKWVLPQENEPHSTQARAIGHAFCNNEIDLLAPSLWLYEVGNVLAIKHPQVAQTLLVHLAGLRIPVFRPSTRLIELATSLVSRHSVTFYDASYHAIAVLTDALFVTADEKYLRKVCDDKHCQHVGDWK